jgi:hypothetical protein
MYGTHTLAFQRIFVRMKIIALIFIRFSYVSLIRNSVTGPLLIVKYLFQITKFFVETVILMVDMAEEFVFMYELVLTVLPVMI